ncbi:MAG: hypothetical protein V3U80_02815 [Flavobacteriaceae bacterium]
MLSKKYLNTFLIQTILMCWLFSYVGYSQQTDVENNILKYWNYRDRLVKNFIVVGPESGQSLPFGTRSERGKVKLSQGEGPIMLGHYIGVLATEYKLLHQNKEDTSQTLKELYYALYAFNRLDLVAETVNGYNKKPKLDGFFVREDYPSNFVEINPSINENAIDKKSFITGSGKALKVKCTTHKGDKFCGVRNDDNCKTTENPQGYAVKYNHRPMSLDQILGVLLGVSLVNTMVDENAVYLDKQFQDNEISIKKEAQNIAGRMISYAKKYHWTPKEPDGDYIGDCGFNKSKPNFFKNNVTMLVFSRFFSKIGKNINGKRYSYIPFIDIFDGVGSIQGDNLKGAFYNRRMYIEMMTLSNKDNNLFLSTAKRVKKASLKYNWEPFYYSLGILLHTWKEDVGIKTQTLQLLNAAPFDGPFYHGLNDFSKSGWATKNRFSATLGEQYNGSRFSEITGNYIGLDYMLLHNMYLLAYGKSTLQYGELKNKNATNHILKPYKITQDKCVISKKQSCKERYKYYTFIYKLNLKSCKLTKKECKKMATTNVNRAFGIQFDPKSNQCKTAVFKEACKKE